MGDTVNIKVTLFICSSRPVSDFQIYGVNFYDQGVLHLGSNQVWYPSSFRFKPEFCVSFCCSLYTLLYIGDASSCFCHTVQAVQWRKRLLVLEGCRGCRVLINAAALGYALCKSTIPSVSNMNHKGSMTIREILCNRYGFPPHTLKVSLNIKYYILFSVRQALVGTSYSLMQSPTTWSKVVSVVTSLQHCLSKYGIRYLDKPGSMLIPEWN